MRPLIWVVIAVLATVAACGQPDGDAGVDEVTLRIGEALRRIRDRDRRRSYFCLDEPLAELWRISDGIANGSNGRSMAEDEVARRLRTAKVILVADDHDVDAVRTNLVGWLTLGLPHAPISSEGGVCLLLEALRRESETEVQSLSLRPPEEAVPGLMRLVCQQWPYPCRAYELLFRQALECGWRILPVSPLAMRQVPSSDVADEARFPVVSGTWDEIDREFEAVSQSVALRALDLLSVGDMAHVIVLCGGLHYFGNRRGVRAALRSAGIEPIVIVPFNAEWEIEIAGRVGDGVADRCCEVSDGVWYGPRLKGGELLKAAGQVERRYHLSGETNDPSRLGGR